MNTINIEGGQSWIEDINQLNLQIDDLEFESIESLSVYTEHNVNLYDLEIENQHNYIVKDLGIVHNGGGKRKGSFAVYLEPWHSDIFDFLDIRKNNGKEEMRARDLFTALWIPDLFMDRVINDEMWSLFSPDTAPNLDEHYGEEFNTLYTKYESEGLATTVVKAREVWNKILESQIETGTPYIGFKDSVNRKSNQSNIGVIKNSNLCIEIVEFTSKDFVAVCNLASISLPAFIEDGKFNHQKLYDVTYQITKNLNRVIDINFYPIEQAKNSNMKTRPIAIGIQGLANVFGMLSIPYDSSEARILNKEISETIYYASLKSSCDLAKTYGKYELFDGSPASKGILQYDMWTNNTVDTVNNKMTIIKSEPIKLSGRWDFDSLKKDIMEYGLRNSLTTGYMPTASTSQILGNNESFEPISNNIYKRSTLSGNFVVVNDQLISELIKLNLWNNNIKNEIIMNEGSIQNIDAIPQHIKDVFKSVWEIKQRSIIDMAADRGAFIDQTQSMNLYFANPNAAKLTSSHFYSYLKGLKTGIYYTRTKSIQSARKDLGMDVKVEIPNVVKKEEYKVDIDESMSDIACSLDNPEACEACGS